MTWLILLIGILMGMILMTIIFWILYHCRVLFYSNCPRQQRMCRSTDYFNHPTDSLLGGNHLKDHLFMNKGELHYKRHLKSTDCSPGSDQIVKVEQPQYCTFYDVNGNPIIGKNVSGSMYVDVNNSYRSINTSNHCIPMSGESVISGEPKLQWHL